MKLIWKITAFNTCLPLLTIGLFEEVFFGSDDIEKRVKKSKLVKFLEKKMK